MLLFTTLPGLDAYTKGDVRTETHSIYGDFTYDFTPQISLSLGGRYTWDNRNAFIFKANYLGGVTSEFGGNPIPLGAPADQFPRQRALQEVHAARLAELQAQRRPTCSMRPSRKASRAAASIRAVRAPRRRTPIDDGVRSYQEIYNYLLFKPETVKSYEIGWKSSLFDHRLSFAADGFYSDYTDVQIPGSVGAVVNGIPTFIGITTNAAKAHIKGAELETTAQLAARLRRRRTRTLTFNGTLGYIDPKYKTFIGPTGVDVSDVRTFQNTPHWTLSGTLGTGLPVGPGKLTASGTVSYRSLTHQFETPSPFLDQPGYTLFDADIVYTYGRYSIGVHGKNLFDKRYKTSGYQYISSTIGGVPILNPAGGYTPTLGKEGIATAFYGNPRQVFGTFTAKF